MARRVTPRVELPRVEAAPPAPVPAPLLDVVVTASGPTPTVTPTAESGAEWGSRPVLAFLVRALLIAVPIAASVVTAVLLSRALPRPAGVVLWIGWWLAIAAVSTVAMAAVDRYVRRLLPLATLLKLSMVFPDKAPSRFQVAARAGTIRNLEQHLDKARAAGVEDEPAKAAERILTLVGALAHHDRRTRGHSERVRAFNDLIADELKLSPDDRGRLRWAALLHDIGKLHVPTGILNKPGKPTAKEWTVLQGHPSRGAEITAPLDAWLGEWAPTIVQHHEKWDGSGYPNGLKGTDICLGARIVAVADAYEVMTAPRPYKRPVSAEAARAELARCAGAHFDPDIVRAFLSVSLGDLRKVMGPLSWLAQLPFIGALPRMESLVTVAGRQVATTAGTASGAGVIAVSGLVSPVAVTAPITALPAAGPAPVIDSGGSELTHQLTEKRQAAAAGRVAAPAPVTTAVAPTDTLIQAGGSGEVAAAPDGSAAEQPATATEPSRAPEASEQTLRSADGAEPAPPRAAAAAEPVPAAVAPTAPKASKREPTVAPRPEAADRTGSPRGQSQKPPKATTAPAPGKAGRTEDASKPGKAPAKSTEQSTDKPGKGGKPVPTPSPSPTGEAADKGPDKSPGQGDDKPGKPAKGGPVEELTVPQEVPVAQETSGPGKGSDKGSDKDKDSGPAPTPTPTATDGATGPVPPGHGNDKPHPKDTPTAIPEAIG